MFLDYQLIYIRYMPKDIQIAVKITETLLIITGIIIEIVGIADDTTTLIFGGGILFAMGGALYYFSKK